MAQAGQEPPDTAPSAVDKSAGAALGKRVAQSVLRCNKWGAPTAAINDNPFDCR